MSCLVLVDIAQSDWAGLADRLATGRSLATSYDMVWVRHFTAALEVMALVDQARYGEAEALLADMREVAFRPEESRINTLQSRLELLFASCRLRLHHDRARQDVPALQLLVAELAAMLPDLEARALSYVWGRLAVLAVLGLMALERRDEAVALLARLLQLAARENWRAMFLGEGWPLQQMLVNQRTALLAAGVPAGFLTSLLAAFPAPVAPLAEPLTERELEVVALIAAGLSNQQIADQLSISYGTAKRHVNNIYTKLAVNSRAQAILKVQELGIV